MVVRSYTIGRLYTKWFRGQLNACQLNGDLTFIETKGLLECAFAVRTTASNHDAIVAAIRRVAQG